jgi:hypothetical protein
MPRSAITAKRSKELTRLSRAEFARDQADTLAFADRNREIVELRLVSRVERRADVSVVRAQTATASMISAGSWHRASQPPRFLLANASTSACSRASSVRARRTSSFRGRSYGRLRHTGLHTGRLRDAAWGARANADAPMVPMLSRPRGGDKSLSGSSRLRPALLIVRMPDRPPLALTVAIPPEAEFNPSSSIALRSQQ